MSSRPTADDWGDHAEVFEVRVTGGAADRRWPLPGKPLRAHAISRVWLGVVIAALAISAALATSLLLGRHDGTVTPQRASARQPGTAGVAGAFGYPQRCLAVTLLADRSTYARADFDRDRLCGRYTGYSTVIFHRVAGAWRVVLDATAYACPVASIPRAVQARLEVCAAGGRR